MQATDKNHSRNEDTSPLNPNQVEGARMLAALGFSPVVLAHYLGFHPGEMVGFHGNQLDEAFTTVSKSAVGNALYDMATSRQSHAATSFWVKRYGEPATTPPPPPPSGKSEKKKPYVWNPDDPNDRVRFRVYNNDGEPNFDL